MIKRKPLKKQLERHKALTSGKLATPRGEEGARIGATIWKSGTRASRALSNSDAPTDATAARLADLERQVRGALDSILDLARDVDRLTRQLEAADLRIQALEGKPQSIRGTAG